MSGSRSTIAKHPNLAEIELALANGISARLIAEKFQVGPYALYRYKARMTPERLTLLRYRRGDSPIDLERLKQGEAESTVQRNVTMMAKLWQLYRLAADAGDHQVAIQAAREYRRYNELQAKLVGELVTADRHLHLNVTDSPAFRRMISLVMAWAADKPDLAAQLAAFLEEQERQAEMIEAKPNGTGTYETQNDTHAD